MDTTTATTATNATNAATGLTAARVDYRYYKESNCVCLDIYENAETMYYVCMHILEDYLLDFIINVQLLFNGKRPVSFKMGDGEISVNADNVLTCLCHKTLMYGNAKARRRSYKYTSDFVTPLTKCYELVCENLFNSKLYEKHGVQLLSTFIANINRIIAENPTITSTLLLQKLNSK